MMTADELSEQSGVPVERCAATIERAERDLLEWLEGPSDSEAALERFRKTQIGQWFMHHGFTEERSDA